MNMRQLAQLAGVSVSTVSKAFSGSKEISAEQREKIFRLARENECYEKYNKVRFDRPVVAVLCPEFQSRYYAQQLDFFAREIKARDGIMVTGGYDFDKGYKNELLRYFVENVKVDGVILYGNFPIEIYNIPTVVIGDSEVYDSIALSMEHAISAAVDSFVANGHRKIAFLGDKYTANKYKHFVQAMQKHGLEMDEDYKVYAIERFEEGGYRTMNQLLSMPTPPTAVLAAYDALAVGAMKSIREHQLKIPEDISIVGMDDTRECVYMDVPLSSVTSFNEELCEIVIDTLFERIKKGKVENRKHIRVSSEFVQRGSVGAVKEK